MILDEAAEDVVAEGLSDVEGVQVDLIPSVSHERLPALHPVPLLVEHLLGPLQEVGHPADSPSDRAIFRFGKRWNIPLKSQDSMAPDVRMHPRRGWP